MDNPILVEALRGNARESMHRGAVAVVDADGADNLLGFNPSGGDGRHDDFHERSQFGSFHGGSLAPVEGFSIIPSIPGRPVALTPVETLDATQSPAIDRGAAGDPFAREPMPNGGFINIGAYGNTEQASKSPLAYVMVLAPNGGESIHPWLIAATAAAHAPVPQAWVSPTPRSHTRNCARLRSITCKKPTLARAGKRG